MIPEYLDIPLFPLPNLTFFPKTVEPLHIFEPRYREMVSCALKGDRLIGIALLREGWQKDYFGNPPIHKTFGVGKIVDYELLEDGRYNIQVEGLYRARLVTEYPTNPFRTCRALVVQDAPLDGMRDEISALREDLTIASDELSEVLPEYASLVRSAWNAHPHPMVVVDLLASAIVLDAYDRQCILEEMDPLRRMKLVLIQLRRIVFEVNEEPEDEPEYLESELFDKEYFDEE